MRKTNYLCLTLLAATNLAAKGVRPNIVLFLVDDLGIMDTEVPFLDTLYSGNLRFHTPNISALAEAGAVYTNAYACPLSSPTRAALLSGMNAAHSHITSFLATEVDTPSDASAGTGGKYAVRDNAGDPFARGEWNWNGLSREDGFRSAQGVTPFPAILADAGYFTIHAGKTHWAPSGSPGCSPLRMGFVSSLCGGPAGYPGSYSSDDNFGNREGKWNMAAVPDLEMYYGTGMNLTEALTEESLAMLDYPVSQGIPFYLQLSHYAVHSPYQPQEPYYSEYLESGMTAKQARYASMVSGMDASLGRVVEYLRGKGILDNTVIIFYSDNGGYSASGANGSKAHTQNAPLREGKGSCYEGGIRVPMIVSWPGHIASGARTGKVVMPEDFYPSILEMAGLRKYSCAQNLDGESFLPGKGRHNSENIDRPVIMHFPHQWRADDQEDIDFLSSIREGRWKLIYRMHDFKLELYDLENDIAESRDVSSEHPDVVRSLAEKLSSALRGWDATMPVVRESGRPVPMPDEIIRR